MAEIPYQILPLAYDGRVVLILWEGLTASDTGAPYRGLHRPQKTFQVFGTFGGGTVTIQGAMELIPLTWTSMRTVENAAMAFAAAGVATAATNPHWVRPAITTPAVAGDLDIYLVAVAPVSVSD